MIDVLERCKWMRAYLAEGFEALARRAGLVRSTEDRTAFNRIEKTHVRDQIGALARSFALEAELTDISYSELEDTIGRIAPAIVMLSDQESFLFVVVGSHRWLHLLAPDLSVIQVDKRHIIAELRRPAEKGQAPTVDALVACAVRDARAAERIRSALLLDRVRMRIGGIWLLRHPPSANFLSQLLHAGVLRSLAIFLTAHAAEYVLLVLAWYTFGRAVLEGRLEGGWLAAWLLLLLSMVPFRMLSAWVSGSAAIRIGALLKRRLLSGALRLMPEEIRREGAGQLLGRVLESNAIESLSISGGLSTVMACVEACVAIFVLASGAGGVLHPVAFVAWLGIYGLLIRQYSRRRFEWTSARLNLTHDLVERMIGHRTRLAQEPREAWHLTEDASLERYTHESRQLDALSVGLTTLLPRLWLLVGIGILVPRLAERHASLPSIAISIGGILLSHRVLRRFGSGLSELVGAHVAWGRIARLFQAAEREQRSALSLPNRQRTSNSLHVQAHGIVFRYRAAARPVLDRIDLEIRNDDRILLEGPSGGGKSTLGAILTGLRSPEAGLLLLDGLDQGALGNEWRASIVSVPQFHENHVFSGTLAFNLLMGRSWPPQPSDLEAATTILGELGLGPLLKRMPSGMQQTVGETGWQLSHGERSRLYIARALLQDARLLIFDESFAALDPTTLRTTLECVLHRAPALMVIAHP